MKFSGFDGWIEIFRGGRQVDSGGVEHDGDALVDKAVATFNAAEHEPPAVIGHPEMNAPAYGWVSGLKSEIVRGIKVLLAKFRDVSPEFADAVASGRFKKRSAAFYPDGRLRHVGFLGAMPPAVKGLANISFNDDAGEPVTFEFQSTKEGSTMDIKFSELFEFLKFWKKETAPAAPEDPEGGGDGGKQFSEADLEAAKKAAGEEARKKAEAEFAESQGKKDAKTKREARRTEISAFCEQLAKEGKIPPSWVKSGLPAFMESLDHEDAIEFSEGAEKKTPDVWFREFLGGFGKSDIFQAIATKEKAGNTAEFAEVKAQVEAGKRIAAKVGGGKKQ